MHKWIQVIIGAIFLAFATLILTNAKAATSKYDGTWVVTITNACEKASHDVSVTIRDSNLTSDEKLLDISGAIGNNGQIDIVVTYNGKTLYSMGHLGAKTGAGIWQTDNCSGKWTALRK